MPSQRIDRRLVLRQGGIAISLPFLDAMLPQGRAACRTPAPSRVVLVGQPLGLYAPNFFPADTGQQFTPSRYLQMLDAHRSRFTVFSGISHRYPAGHFAEVALFTGVSPEQIRESEIRNGISLDQEIAAHVGQQTRFPSLILGGGNAAWNRRGVRIPSETRATQVFRRLFLQGTADEEARELKRVQNGQSLLDNVREQIHSMHRKVGRADQDRLDLFLSSVREAEQMLQQDEQWRKTPKPSVDYPTPTTDFNGAQLVERSRQWYHLVHLALQTDSTRTISLWLSTQERPEITGVNLGHHDASHHGQDPAKLDQLAIIEQAELQVFAEFLDRLNATRESESTLLDSTAVLYASNLGNSSSHDNTNLPVLLAGGRFRHQGHLAFDTKNNTPLSNLFVRILQHMGVESTSFGASTDTIRDL